MAEEVKRGKIEDGKRTAEEIRMEDMGDEAEGILGTPWQMGEPSWECD